MTEPIDYVRHTINEFIMICDRRKSDSLCHYIDMTNIIKENGMNEENLASLKKLYLNHMSSITRYYEYCKYGMEIYTSVDEDTIKQQFSNATTTDICFKRIRRYHLDVREAEDIYKMHVNWYTNEYEKIMNMPLIPVLEETKPPSPPEETKPPLPEETKPPSPPPKNELFVENNQNTKFKPSSDGFSNEEKISQIDYIHRVHHLQYPPQRIHRSLIDLIRDDDSDDDDESYYNKTKKYNYA
jgi:hypothetical protein